MTLNTCSTPILLIVLALATAVPRTGVAQTFASVRVPRSAIDTYSPNACTIKATRIALPNRATVRDTLKVSIENDQNVATATTSPLYIRINAKLDSVVAGASAAIVVADSGVRIDGQLISITRSPGAQLVCAQTVPMVDPVGDDMTVQRAFRVGVGASFNFLSGVSGTDLYADATVFLPTIWSTKRGAFGIDAGLVNARAVSEDTLGDARHLWILGSAMSDTLTVVDQRRSQRARQQLDRLGLFVAPTYRVASHLYLVVQGEVFNNTIAETSFSQVIDADTARVARGDRILDRSPRRVARDSAVTTADTSRFRYTVFEPFVGVGVILNFRLSDVEFRTKPIVGYGEPFGSGGAYYAVQFRVTDFDNGFKLGGEVRGLVKGSETSVLVYLAKDFGFKRLASFLVGGDQEK